MPWVALQVSDLLSVNMDGFNYVDRVESSFNATDATTAYSYVVEARFHSYEHPQSSARAAVMNVNWMPNNSVNGTMEGLLFQVLGLGNVGCDSRNLNVNCEYQHCMHW